MTLPQFPVLPFFAFVFFMALITVWKYYLSPSPTSTSKCMSSIWPKLAHNKCLLNGWVQSVSTATLASEHMYWDAEEARNSGFSAVTVLACLLLGWQRISRPPLPKPSASAFPALHWATWEMQSFQAACSPGWPRSPWRPQDQCGAAPRPVSLLPRSEPVSLIFTSAAPSTQMEKLWQLVQIWMNTRIPGIPYTEEATP